MMSVLNSTVMDALMSAASYAKQNQFCTGLAHTSEDEAAAQRAMGYANSYRDKAMTAKEETQEALAEQTQQVREEAQLEQQALEARMAEKNAEALAANTPDILQPAAILELSAAYQNSALGEDAVAETFAAPVNAAPAPVQTSSAPLSRPSGYMDILA